MVAGYILSGGKNRRMQGRAKLFLTYRGHSFYEYIRNALEDFPEIYLSVARETEELYLSVPLPQIVDIYSDAGPLGGICSGLKLCPGADALFVTACDMPFIAREDVGQVMKVYQEYRDRGEEKVVVAQTGEKVQPLFGVYPRSILGIIEAMLEEKDYKLQNLLRRAGAVAVLLSEGSRAGRNINCIEEYRELNRLQGKGGPMLQLEEAIECLLQHIQPIRETESISLLSSTNRILSTPLLALADQPPFPRSPLDGYAVRGRDTQGAGKNTPVQLSVIGTVYAGEVFSGTVGENEAVRITTGAPIPQGADTVIRQEDTDGGRKQVQVYRGSSPYENYCCQGEDYKKGEILLERGTRMDGIAMALAAGLGNEYIEVYRKPRIAVISTGDELIQPGIPLEPGKIYDTNRHLISGRLLDFGITPFASLHGRDDAKEMAQTLHKLSQKADLILTTGGVSVGEKDIMHQVLPLLSAEKLFWRVEIKPGAPTLAAVLGNTLIVCLSGNPFAAAANFELLVRPVIGKLTGDGRWIMKKCRGVMENDFKKPKGTRRFIRGYADGGRVWASAGSHASGTLAAMAGSNCLIEISREQAGAKKGEEVWIYLR